MYYATILNVVGTPTTTNIDYEGSFIYHTVREGVHKMTLISNEGEGTQNDHVVTWTT